MSKQFQLFSQSLPELGQQLKQQQQSALATEAEVHQTIKQLPVQLQKLQPASQHLVGQNPLQPLLKKISQTPQKLALEWQKNWSDYSLRQQLSENFSDKMVLLLLGQVNSGKSTLGNALADLMPGKKSWFKISEQGETLSMSEGFKTGCVETTRTVEGFSAGSLVVIDVPGLHSVTEACGELARKFADLADVTLCITNSGAPGKSHEIEEFIQHARRNKPCLPIISAADEHYQDEANGQVVKVFDMKPPSVQKQQQDYFSGELAKLELPMELLPAVSLSAKYLTTKNTSANAMVDSGFDQLFAALNRSIPQVIDYKKQKPQQLLNTCINEQILPVTARTLSQPLEKLITELEQQRQFLHQQCQQLPQQLQRLLQGEFSTLVEQYKNQGDTRLLQADLQKCYFHQLEKLQKNMLDGFFSQFEKSMGNLPLQDMKLGDFKKITAKHVQTTYTKTVTGSGVGAVAGFFLGGPLGAAIGGTLGGAAGHMMDKDIVTMVELGTDSQQVLQSSLQWLEKSSKQSEKQFTQQLEQLLQPLHSSLVTSQQAVVNFEQKLSHYQ